MKFNAHVNRCHADLVGSHSRHLIVLLLVIAASGCDQSDSGNVMVPNPGSESRSHSSNTIADERTEKSSRPSQIRDTTLSVREAWRIEGLGAPAGLAYDADANELRLAQIGGEGDAKDADGVISRVSISGEILEFFWSRGMNAPKDLVFDQASIWVTDIDAVIELDRKTGTVRQTIPVPDARFLVGIAIDVDHRLLFADLLASRISSLKDGEFRVLHEGTELQSPSKLLFTENGVIVASWGSTTDFSDNDLGSVFYWKSESRTVTPTVLSMQGHWMGLCSDGGGGWFVADFETGSILRIRTEGPVEKMIELGRGTGGILYLPERRLLLVTHVTKNWLAAFRLSDVVASSDRTRSH